MNKKIERMITAGMIAALVAVFFYQVAYGATITDVAKKVGFKLMEFIDISVLNLP